MKEIRDIIESCRFDIETFMDEEAIEKLTALFEMERGKNYLIGFKDGCYTNIGFEYQPRIQQDFSEDSTKE